MESSKRILLKFKKENGKYYSLTIKNAKEGVGDEEIKNLMNKIIEKKIIKQGSVLVSGIKGASFVETQKKNFDIA